MVAVYDIDISSESAEEVSDKSAEETVSEEEVVKFNRASLYDKYKQLYRDQISFKRRNAFLQKKMAEYYKNRKVREENSRAEPSTHSRSEGLLSDRGGLLQTGMLVFEFVSINWRVFFADGTRVEGSGELRRATGAVLPASGSLWGHESDPGRRGGQHREGTGRYS